MRRDTSHVEFIPVLTVHARAVEEIEKRLGNDSGAVKSLLILSACRVRAIVLREVECPTAEARACCLDLVNEFRRTETAMEKHLLAQQLRQRQYALGHLSQELIEGAPQLFAEGKAEKAGPTRPLSS